MNDQYHLDLSKYSLDTFKNMLRSRILVPSRTQLKDKLEERFRKLKIAGINTMKDLLEVLKTKPKLEQFSKTSGVSIDYLTLLKREANSYLPSPVRLEKFPGISIKYAERLAAEGITHSRHIFCEAREKIKRDPLAQKTRIPRNDLDEFIGLSDLVRVYGVGPVFARILYDMGVTSIQVLRSYKAEDLIRIYEESIQKKADFGVHEIQFSLEMAHDLDIVVEI